MIMVSNPCSEELSGLWRFLRVNNGSLVNISGVPHSSVLNIGHLDEI
jgi:hypothetical protein